MIGNCWEWLGFFRVDVDPLDFVFLFTNLQNKMCGIDAARWAESIPHLIYPSPHCFLMCGIKIRNHSESFPREWFIPSQGMIHSLLGGIIPSQGMNHSLPGNESFPPREWFIPQNFQTLLLNVVLEFARNRFISASWVDSARFSTLPPENIS